MANDISSNASPTATQAEMDDILSSIRSGVEEEGSKVGNGSADLIDAAAAQEGEEADVLELSETDMVAVGGDAGQEEELIDLEAFGANGEAKVVAAASVAAVAEELTAGAAVGKAPVEAVAGSDAADEFDRLLAEISQEQQQQVEASKVSKEELMAEEEPLGEAAALDGDDSAEMMVAAPEVDEGVEEGPVTPVEPVAADTTLAPSVGDAGKSFKMGSIEGPDGVQVTLPAEVLAMALRPMVQDWLAKNLPDVVERLVKEEISKLAQN